MASFTHLPVGAHSLTFGQLSQLQQFTHTLLVSCVYATLVTVHFVGFMFMCARWLVDLLFGLWNVLVVGKFAECARVNAVYTQHVISVISVKCVRVLVVCRHIRLHGVLHTQTNACAHATLIVWYFIFQTFLCENNGIFKHMCVRIPLRFFFVLFLSIMLLVWLFLQILYLKNALSE